MNSSPKITSGIDERLKELCPKLDISEVPPINQKRLVTFINHFLSNIADFLDQFARHCTSKLLHFDKQLNKFEAELCILESKLNSIPEVADKKDVNVELPKPEELESKKEELPVPNEVKPILPVEAGQAEENKEKKPQVVEEREEHPELARFRKMVQVGVPLQAVKLKMQIEGLDPNLIDS